MGETRVVGRIVAVAAIVAVVVIVAIVLLGASSPYTLKADFVNSSQLVKGNLVEVAGSKVGTVTDLQLTPNGQAQVTFNITDSDYSPLRQGTIATIRQASLSGVANRYIELRLPPGEPPKIPSGSTLSTDETNSAVDLDQLFNTFDPPTRAALSGTIKGFATLYGGRGPQLNQAYEYLNPELASSSRLFTELNYDTPLFERFIVASSAVVTDLATRQSDLSGLVVHLSSTLGAIGSERAALASAIQQLPPFFRRADTTFVNLRQTLSDLTPLVNDSKPVAIELKPFLAQLQPLANDARPTLRDLSALLHSNTPNSDLLALTNTTVPVRDIAIGPVQVNGRQSPGSFPASTQALTSATPELAFGRPYVGDLESWFNSFGTSGDADALGSVSRSSPNLNAFANINGVLSPIPSNMRSQAFAQLANVNQRNRCPGAAEHGSVYKPAPDFNCDPTQTLPGQ